MEVLDPLQNLLETAFDLATRHATLLDRSVEITAWTVLHDLAPMMSLVLDQIDRLHDVGMMQCRRYTEFGRQFFDVVLLGFVLAAFSEFLRVY